MPLIRNGDWAEDEFATVADDAPLPDGAAIVSLKRFEAERESLLARNVKLGVRLGILGIAAGARRGCAPAVRDRAGIPELPRRARLFLGRMLRTRMGYKGEIRAVGGFLVDQLAYLTRVGCRQLRRRCPHHAGGAETCAG